MIRKHPQNGSLKSISTFEAGSWPAGIQPGKIYEDTVLAAVKELYSPTVQFLSITWIFFYNSSAKPNRELLKLPIQGYV